MTNWDKIKSTFYFFLFSSNSDFPGKCFEPTKMVTLDPGQTVDIPSACFRLTCLPNLSFTGARWEIEFPVFCFLSFFPFSHLPFISSCLFQLFSILIWTRFTVVQQKNRSIQIVKKLMVIVPKVFRNVVHVMSATMLMEIQTWWMVTRDEKSIKKIEQLKKKNEEEMWFIIFFASFSDCVVRFLKLFFLF